MTDSNIYLLSHTYQRSNTVEFSIKEQIIIHLLRKVIDAFLVLPTATGKQMKNILVEAKDTIYK